MNKPLLPLSLPLVVAALAVACVPVAQAQIVNVSASISGTAASGGWNYTISLENTGSTNLNSFWYGWIQGGNDLPSNPSGAANSLGWANNLDANSIQWVNGTGTALAPLQTATFTFFSTDSPTAITTSPSGESVVYAHGIDFSQGSPGDSSGIFSPALVNTPEPTTTALLAFGAVGLVVTGWRRIRAQ